MPGMAGPPQVVRDAVNGFGDLFLCEPERRHLAEYLTGLMIAERKTVLGINREFAHTTDQSCLNRFVTEVKWDETELNERRLAWQQRDSRTRHSDRGVIPIDNVLIDHDGQFIKDVGWFWDHAEQRKEIGHDYLIVNCVCTSGEHYPLEFRRFRKKDQREATGEEFLDHTVLCCQLVDWEGEREIPGDFVFDSYFTNAQVLNHIHSKNARFGRPRGYVGDLKFNRKIQWQGRVMKAEEMAAQIDPESRKPFFRGRKRQWYFTATIRIPDVHHKVRIVFIWNHKRDGEARKILVTNRVTWEVCRTLQVYRRWRSCRSFAV